MPSAMPHSVILSQLATSTVLAEDLTKFLPEESLCKPVLPILSPVEVLFCSGNSVVQKTSPVCSVYSSSLVSSVCSVTTSLPTKNTVIVTTLPTIASSLSVSTYGTCASTVVSGTRSDSCRAVLSPLAQSFVMSEAVTPYLYPAGLDKFGRSIVTHKDSAMHLDYFFDVSKPVDAHHPTPALPDIADVQKLSTWPVELPEDVVFMDRVLPAATSDVCLNKEFPPEYFLQLHEKVKLGGTYNFAGSRVKLLHSQIKVDKFRCMLKGYDDISILQFLDYGFPIGLAQNFELQSCTKNHSSSYEFFSSIDEFFSKEVSLRGVTGPLISTPFPSTMVSPLMTAIKKPSSRRPVFDASYGDFSINNNTPEKEYLGEAYSFTFPTVLDLAELVIELGPGCLLWKRDLSRWFLQLPVDPGDYDKLGVIWRGAWFVFLSFVWGCRHAGYNAQRVSSSILFILERIGLKKFNAVYNAMVYIDDFAGAEKGDRAWDAFNDLGVLLAELGVVESKKKALPPSTQMVFLGVEFDTVQMCMRIGAEKLLEVKATIDVWYRRTVATKQELQSLQGQLMWISKVVLFSRCFVTRIIAEQKSLKSQKQKKTLSHDVKKDLLWWKTFLDVFNGIELIVPLTVFCNILGDATLNGAGAWNEELGQFWSRQFPFSMRSPDIPIHLKEFFTVIISVRIWGHLWSGKRVALHCDNSSVVETINYQKPKNFKMQQCLREFLYLVTTMKFEPVMVRIPTNDNFLADFVSRNHIQDDIKKEFSKLGVKKMDSICVPDEMFFFTADW